MATTSLNFFRDGRDVLLVFPSANLCRRRDEGGFCFSGWRTRRDNKLLADAGSLSLDFFIFDRAEIEYKIFRDSEPRRGGSSENGFPSQFHYYFNFIATLLATRRTFGRKRSNANSIIIIPISLTCCEERRNGQSEFGQSRTMQ